MKARHFIILLTIICLISATYSCSTQKKAAGNRQQEKIELAVKQINAATHSLDTRYTVQTGSLRLKGQIKISEDSCLWFSVQLLGMEAGRVLLTDSSIQMIYRMQKMYFKQDGLDYLPLIRRCANAIFLHKIILPDGKEPTISDFITVKTEDGGWQLIRHESPASISYILDEHLQLVESQCEIDGYNIKAIYSSFEDGFPTRIKLTAPNDNSSIELELNKIIRNNIQSTEFSIPQGYHEVSVGQLLRMLNLK